MEPMPILVYPDPFLKKACRPISAMEIASGSADGWALKDLADRMALTLKISGGAGLAAPQVGVGLRLIVIEGPEGGPPLTVLNPIIHESRGSVTHEEGCLSVPGIFTKVKRKAWVRLAGFGLDGKPVTIESERLAVVCQHEVDHLDGMLFTDRLGMAARLLSRRGLERLEREYLRRSNRATA